MDIANRTRENFVEIERPIGCLHSVEFKSLQRPNLDILESEKEIFEKCPLLITNEWEDEELNEEWEDDELDEEFNEEFEKTTEDEKTYYYGSYDEPWQEYGPENLPKAKWHLNLNVENALKMNKEQCGEPSKSCAEIEKVLKKTLKLFGVDSAERERTVFRFDWHNTEYKDLVRLNSLLVASYVQLLDIREKYENDSSVMLEGAYQIRPIGRIEAMCVGAKNNKFEVEFCSPDYLYGKNVFKGRLYLRSKKNEDESILSVLSTFADDLKKLSSFIAEVENAQNEILYKHWLEECYTMREWRIFFEYHSKYFYTSKQVKNFLSLIGAKNVNRNFKNVIEENDPCFLTEEDFKNYTDMLVGLLNEFLPRMNEKVVEEENDNE